MTPYLFYVFGKPGADDLYVLNCVDDEEAGARAEWLLTLHPDRQRVEAWDEDRRVAVARAGASTPSTIFLAEAA